MSASRLLALTLTAVLLTPALLHAHAVVYPQRSAPGAYERYRLVVPNERPVPTSRVELVFPDDVTVVSFMEVPGWTLDVRRAPDGRITGAVWTGEIGVERFVELPFIAVNPREDARLQWEAVQTYANGEIVRWDGPEESDRPASFTVVEEPEEERSLVTPTLVSLGAVLVALVGLGFALRRSPPAGSIENR